MTIRRDTNPRLPASHLLRPADELRGSPALHGLQAAVYLLIHGAARRSSSSHSFADCTVSGPASPSYRGKFHHNEVNRRMGYAPIDIRSPRELENDE